MKNHKGVGGYLLKCKQNIGQASGNYIFGYYGYAELTGGEACNIIKTKTIGANRKYLDFIKIKVSLLLSILQNIKNPAIIKKYSTAFDQRKCDFNKPLNSFNPTQLHAI